MSDIVSRITTVNASERLPIGLLAAELWQYRGLIWAFAVRDIKVKYFQTLLGPLWVLFTPLITVGVMTFVFGLMIRIPSDGLPYIIFYLVAIIPWYAFMAVLNQTISSLEAHASLINKIYFPRLVIGAAYAVNGCVDFLVGFVVVCAFAAYFSLLSPALILAMPFLLAIQMAWALGIGFLLAPYNARYRDVKHLIPLIVQLYYFANPILYPVSVAPAWAQWIYVVNPFAVVINTYRSLLNGSGVDWISLGLATALSLLVFLLGVISFLRRERHMIDVL